MPMSGRQTDPETKKTHSCDSARRGHLSRSLSCPSRTTYEVSDTKPRCSCQDSKKLSFLHWKYRLQELACIFTVSVAGFSVMENYGAFSGCDGAGGFSRPGEGSGWAGNGDSGGRGLGMSGKSGGDGDGAGPPGSGMVGPVGSGIESGVGSFGIGNLLFMKARTES